MNAFTIAEAGRWISNGEVSSRELTQAVLDGIDAIDGALSSFVLTDEAGALAAADAADAAVASGEAQGPLVGVPVAVKDIIDMAGLPTRCGSAAYPATAVGSDATVVALLRRAGAVIVGKTTAHELACGVYSAPASNPWDTARLPGGSSGGSGAAVAAGIVPMALGSDTGGSIRIPAAVCGIAGLKPTYGRVSKAGVEPLAWSLDHIGPLAATVEDCALTLGAIAGADPADPSTVDFGIDDYTGALGQGIEGQRIGVLDAAPFSPLQPAVAAAFAAAVDTLASLGADVVPVAIPELRFTIATEFGIVGPEAAEYHRLLLRDRPGLIDPGIRALLVAGALLPAEHYLKAAEARAVITHAVRKAFDDARLAALVSPTLPATAALQDQEDFVYGEETEPVTISYVRTTAPFNLTGLPALSIPCGFDGGGLPIGLQIAGRPFDEATVLAIGHTYETATAWHRARPAIHIEEAA